MAFATAVTADTLLFDYLGFDYENPDPNPASFGEPGSSYVGIGTVPGLFAPLTADTTTFQYTYMLSGLTPVGTLAFGTYLIVDYSPGTLSIYEDAKLGGTGADYGNFPPNATAPSSFTDGTLFLTGTLNSFQFVYNSATNTGSYNASYTITGGSQIVNFPINQRDGWTFSGASGNALSTGGSQIVNFPINQRDGWTFSGASGNALSTPDGYLHQVDGQNFLGAVPARTTSWGRIKASYR